MKKFGAVLTSLFMLIFFAACGSNETPSDSVNTVKPVITTPDVPSSPSENTGDTNTPDVEPEPTWTGRVINTDNGVNVRAEANTESEILTTADNGEEFIVVEQGTWYRVVLDNGTLGYISSDYMEIVEN